MFVVVLCIYVCIFRDEGVALEYIPPTGPLLMGYTERKKERESI
jgi:hypothetical protein